MKNQRSETVKSKTFQIIGDAKIQQLIDRLDQSNEHYLLVETNSSVKIKIPELKLTYMCTPDYMSFKNWGTLASIKSHLKKSGLIETLPKIDRREIQYFKFRNCMYFDKNSKRGEVREFENVAEYDISGAYIQAAHNLGILTAENFKKLKDGPKANRLKILGALATVKTEYYIHKGEVIDEGIVTDKALRNELKASKLVEYFKNHNFELKHVPLERFFLYNSRRGPVAVVKREGQELKTFYIPHKKTINYEIRS